MATNPTAQRVAAEVRANLARLRISRQSFADSLDMSLSAATRRLNGDVPFTVDEIYRAAEVLDIAPTSLLPGELTTTK